MKKIFIALGVVLLIILMGIGGRALRVLFFPVNTFDKSVDVAYEVVDTVMTAENAIYNYEWFKKQEAYIRECYTNEDLAKEEYDLFLGMLPEDREKWSRLDKTEESSLRNSYYALQKLTNKAIEDYNAKSSMATKEIFKDNLPSNIDRALYGGQKLTN